jgi:hypothetical protein
LSSLSYQQMPHWLHQPLMQGAINLAEAAELWDEWLMTGEPDRFCPESQYLQDAVLRINLLQWELHRAD